MLTSDIMVCRAVKRCGVPEAIKNPELDAGSQRPVETQEMRSDCDGSKTKRKSSNILKPLGFFLNLVAGTRNPSRPAP